MSNSDWRAYRDAVVIIPNSILGRLQKGLLQRNRLLHDLLFVERGTLRPALQRAYDSQFGGLILYALGVRTVGEMERLERERRRNPSKTTDSDS